MLYSSTCKAGSPAYTLNHQLMVLGGYRANVFNDLRRNLGITDVEYQDGFK